MGAIEDFVTRCRRKLVDTTMRNRLLHFRPGTRSGSIEIVDEHPAAIWESIVVGKRAMVVRGQPDDPEDADGAAAPGLFGNETDPQVAEPVSSLEQEVDAFAEAIAPATTERHRDNYLETRVGSTALATKLLRLSDTARLTLEEQGVATLFLALGALRFFEAESSDQERRAPLLLVPVVLEREGKDRWRVRLGEDDPIVNPALVEYLREQHRLELPELPEALEGFSPLAWYREVQGLISSKPRWRVTADCILGIFSFQKFVMHEDLKRNASSLSRHEVIGQLATRSGTGGGRPQLPPDVAALELDRDFPVETTPLVVDADSSQLRALAAVSRGHHMVIEGPPGTGKSQTIANLIAGALHAGKSVLFVAEKQAALNVVYDRLKKCGLGDSCFEVHSSKANKAAVLRELGRSLDASLVRAPANEFDAARLGQVRAELSEYARALHELVQPLGRSAYGTVGRLAALDDAPSTRVVLKTEGVTGEQLSRTMELLSQLRRAAALVTDPATHPWRDATRHSLDIDVRESIESSLRSLGELVPAIEEAISASAVRFGTPANPTLPEALAFVDVADVLVRSPGLEARIAGDGACSGSEASEARSLIERGRALAKSERESEETFREGVDLDLLSADAETIDRRGGSRVAWLFSSWRRARKALRRAVQEQAWKGAAAAARAVRSTLDAVNERKALARAPAGPERFGVRWKGGDSDWDDLDRVCAWLQEFRALVSSRNLSSPAVELVTRPRPNVDELRKTIDLCAQLQAAWKSLSTTVGWPAGYGEEQPFRSMFERVRALHDAPLAYREWLEFHALLGASEPTVAAPIVREAVEQRLRWDDLPRAFERRFSERWLDARAESVPSLRRFLGETHAARIAEFRELDRTILEHHRRALAARLRVRAQERLREPSLAGEVAFLRGQLARQRGHKPLRQLLRGACGAIQALKPCFLMSPMTVAQGLDPEKHRFDLVVFDEASQMTPEDALGAILRGKQVVVVGDPKQLPPTNFFAVQSGQVQASGGEGGLEYEDLDSVLELATAAGFYGTTLRWHYRSRHESLIAYSNRNFYSDRPLFTFPGADIDRRVRGLHFEFVADGLYEGEGVNRAEAQRVVEAVVAHARDNPTVSLGVGTFSLGQQLAVQDALERRRREEPWLEEFLSLDKAEPFFVKNLESIQGDERDVVILSITYGRGAEGKVRHNFGPINGQNGWRRLNVLTTRARERMIVFSSMHADDIDLTKAPSSGAGLLRAFLRYAESDVLEGNAIVDVTAAAESPFEVEVGKALAHAGVRIHPQVGVAGYRVDLGILDAETEGRFVCGIECDGVTYHAAESARDRDRLREEVLGRLGWTLHRVWSLDWWHDRKGQTERLLRLIEKSKGEARNRGAAPIRGANVERSPADSASDGGSPSAAVGATMAPPSSSSVAFVPYRVSSPRVRREEIAASTPKQLAEVMSEILRAEGPLHEDDLRGRTLVAYGLSREGSRISGVLNEGFQVLRARGDVETDGSSWRLSAAPAVPRNREQVAMTAERIPSWEYDAAVLAVLKANACLTEDALVATVRDAFGYGAASAALRRGVLDAVSRLTKSGTLGIGSGGLRLVGETPRA